LSHLASSTSSKQSRGIFESFKTKSKTILIFMLGGTNYAEIQTLREMIGKRVSTSKDEQLKVYFGSTALLTPSMAASFVFQG
jgi:hypothetical protein